MKKRENRDEINVTEINTSIGKYCVQINNAYIYPYSHNYVKLFYFKAEIEGLCEDFPPYQMFAAKAKIEHNVGGHSLQSLSATPVDLHSTISIPTSNCWGTNGSCWGMRPSVP